MHRILNVAGNEKNNDDLIEQPAADFIYITSVKADLNLISKLLLEKEFASLKNNIRALEISNLNYSIVFFISPKKIKKITAQIQKYFSDRDILITREMTKLHEEYIRDKVKNLKNINITEKGEITVVISENSNLENRLQVIEESVKKKIIKLLKKMSIKDITSKISKENNISKKIVYDYCLKKKNEI